MCAKIAYLLMGKHKPIYRQDCTGYGDQCIVVNALNLRMTGRGKLDKVLRYHTGFIGHLKEIPIRKMIEEKPEQLVFFYYY